jgi:integrase
MGRAPGTIENYALPLSNLVKHLGNKPLASITKGDVLSYAQAQRERVKVVDGQPIRQMAESTIRLHLRQIRTFLCHFGHDVIKNKELPKVTERTPDVYTANQLSTLFANANGEQYLHFAFLLGTGLRKGEGENLQWTDLDLDAKLMTVQNKKDWKTKNRKVRYVPIPDHLISALLLKREKTPDAAYVLGNGKNPDTEVRYKLKRVAFAAGLNCGQCVGRTGRKCSEGPWCQKVTLHKLRRSYATLLHGKGVSIRTLQMLLGHSSPVPIMRYLAPADALDPQLLVSLNASFKDAAYLGD